MKISEFAALNHVTAKLLRYYDEIGLLKPSCIDAENGYRTYDAAQSYRLDWILILKNLGFALGDIRTLLEGPVDSRSLIPELIRKRRDIGEQLNEQTQKKLQIDRLILLLEKEGFHMNEKIDLMRFEKDHVHDIKKNMPNMETFNDGVHAILSLCSDQDDIGVLRFDISHFKQVNDTHGYEVGDRVIVACHDAIMAAIAPFGVDACLGRAHGDEFVVFAKAGPDRIRSAAEETLKHMAVFDWKSIGCSFAMTAKIGILSTKKGSEIDIRQTIDDASEAMYAAAAKGPGSIELVRR